VFIWQIFAGGPAYAVAAGINVSVKLSVTVPVQGVFAWAVSVSCTWPEAISAELAV
jgi:hypothetical protein